MAGLKLRAIEHAKPIKVTHGLPSQRLPPSRCVRRKSLHETGQPIQDPAKLNAPMLAWFMAADRSFRKARQARQRPSGGEGWRSESNLKKAANAGFSLSARQYAEKSNRLGPVPSRSSR